MRALARGWVAGAWAGAMVGLAEAALVLATSVPEELGLVPFAFLAYGAIGSAIGLAVALAAWFIRRTADAEAPWAAALAVFALAIVVGRYHVIQRVFHEDLPMMSPTGVAVHIAIVLAALILAFLFYRLVRASHVQRVFPALIIFVVIAALAIVGARLSASAAVEVVASRTATATGRPNAVLIIADTLRADSVANRIREKPAGGFARLARDGTYFPRAHAQSTWTRPSVATLMTSLYPSQHGAVQKMEPLPDDVTTVAEIFREEGYWTAAFVSNINVAPIFNFQQGFGEYHYLSPSFYFGASDSATRLAIYKGLRVMRERLMRDRIYFQNYYQDAAVLTESVRQWLDGAPPSPFFLLVHFMDPHDPYFEIPYNGRGVARVNNPNPPPDRAGEMRRLYEQNIDYLDEHLARVFEDLERRGLYQSSVIALVSDHGEEFQEHGGWWHGATLYEEQLQVPVLFKRGNEAKPNLVSSDQARLLDVAPTLLAASGLEIPGDFAGRDLHANSSPEPLFAEEELEGNLLSAVRLGDWKLITANASNPRGLAEVELYNLAADPAERNNVAAQQPAKVEELAALLDQFHDVGFAPDE